MRLLLLLAGLLSGAAQADLYRWVDPETGSIRFSNHPPPPGARTGAVEVVPYRPVPEKAEKAERAPAAPPKPVLPFPLQEKK